MPTKADLEKALAPFLALNSHSQIDQISLGGGQKLWAIQKPWDDPSLVIRIPDDGEIAKFAAVLNLLLLPPRFSAIWHNDTKDMEVVWTAWKLAGPQKDLIDRKFTLSLDKRDYLCEFADSSAELLLLASHAVHVSSSESGHRNLTSFEMYASGEKDLLAMLDKPRSFWIRNVPWLEDEIVDLAYHVNFYMSYFDDKTSKIIIHPTPAVSAVKPQNRYISDKFPKHIKAKTIDPNILHFWSAAHGADDQAKSFLYYYRLIEYASTSYLHAEGRAAVKKLLAEPDLLDDVAGTTERLVLALQTTKQDDETKILHLLEDTIKIPVIWQEIQNNIGAFTTDTVFEGGFSLPPLLPKSPKQEQFDVAKFAKHTKEIRNALSHGRDIRTQMVIIPTQKNFDLLQPWVTLMCVAAGQIVLLTPIS